MKPDKKQISEDVINAEQYSVEELREVVFGNSDRLPKVLALTLLGRKDYPNKLADFQRVLEDESVARGPRLSSTTAEHHGRRHQQTNDDQ